MSIGMDNRLEAMETVLLKILDVMEGGSGGYFTNSEAYELRKLIEDARDGDIETSSSEPPTQ